ncbi:MAG: hypothetical protein IJ106_11955 [Parasporobacterium sp.]|nr:hypothetical protein [Parasporobacterium sp.]
MSQELFFVPEKLIETRRLIEASHKDSAAAGTAGSGEELGKLISRLCGSSEEMVKASSLAMSDREVRMLAGYLPRNDYGIRGERLFQALRYRLDEHTCGTLFRQWQEEYSNAYCNSFLKDLARTDQTFQKFLKKHHTDPELFAQILEGPSIPLSYDEKLLGGTFADGADFERKLRYFGVAEQSMLDIECKQALLTFCGRADYFSCSEDNLLDIVRTYDGYLLKRFLLNFMEKLSLGELQAYPALTSYLRQVIGHRGSRTFRQFFEDVPPEMLQKYLDWIHLFKINLYFEEDDRSRFWKQYRYVNVVRYPISNVVILEFENHVAVEFLGDQPGTIYLCEKNEFNRSFYDKLDAMDNEDLRIFFKAHKDQCLEYRNHTGRWQSHLNNLFSRRGIAQKIRI